MSRVKTGVVRRRSHKKLLATTKGYRMTRNRLVRVANEAALHAGQYAYVGRKDRKRDFRRLWISRISSALTGLNSSLNYSRFISQLKKANIELDRKVLAEIAFRDLESFKSIVERAVAA